MKFKAGGFTLIELMIFLVIIGVLAAVAMPTYQTYTYKAQMSALVLAASVCRTSISEVFQTAASSAGAGNWGCESASSTSKFVNKVSTADNGSVRVQPFVGGNEFKTAAGLAATEYLYVNPVDSAGVAAAVYSSINAWKCGATTATMRKLLLGSCSNTVTAASFYSP